MKNLLCLTLMLGVCCWTGCQTAAKVGEAAGKISQKIDQIQEGVTNANNKVDGLRADLVKRIQEDPDLTPSEKDDLLKEIGGAPGGLLGLGALASLGYAYLKKKALAKAQKALGTVLKAEQELPEESVKLLRSTMKDLGGDHPSVKETIAAAKQQ